MQVVASFSMGDKHMSFSAENFRNQDKLIRFYTGIVNWNVFLQLFNKYIPTEDVLCPINNCHKNIQAGLIFNM